MDSKISFGDLFAGGGGTSTGAFSVPGIHVSWALNHSPVAIKTHEANHPETKHYQADIRPQLTRQTKQLITVEKKFLAKYYNGVRPDGREQHHCQSVELPFPTIRTNDGTAVVTAKAQFYTRPLTNDYANQPLEKPSPTITTFGGDSLVTVKAQFVSKVYNSNGNPGSNNQSIESPLGSPTTRDKFQFITTYFSSPGSPGSQNQSVEKPLGTILTEPNKRALVTVDCEDLLDFDIKMRFLTEDELAAIMGFPEGYFKNNGLKLSKKSIIKLVGNAVPVGMAKALLEPVVNWLRIEKMELIA